MNHPIDNAQIQRWASDVHAALRLGDPDRARAPLAQLATQLPQHPGVIALRRWAALIEFDWPATRGSVAIGPREPPAADAVDLVLFHVDLPVAPSGVHGKIDYLAVAALSFEAAERRAPQAHRILLTDAETNVPQGLGAHEVIRQPIDRDRLMYERMRVQERYLARRPLGRATVFMDVDVVANRDPVGIFAEDFDVGLTWRAEHPDAPINGGLIFVGPGAAGRAFFQQALRCYDALAVSRLASLFEQDLRGWWGDQFALGLIVGYRDFGRRQQVGMSVNATRVRFFPCAEYNFTPDANGTDALDHLASRYFLHFKGNRKPLQARYLDQVRRGAAWRA
jgi:hypothetical protein